MKIGIIGLGTVGKAIADTAFAVDATYIIDINPDKNNSSYKEILTADAIFVCVPSPMDEDGSCNSLILEETVSKLKGFTGTIISKVTAPPDVYKRLGNKFPNLVYCPEFLREASAHRDLELTEWVVIGGTVKAYLREAERILRFCHSSIKKVELCSLEEAAMFKYVVNSFLATKIVFFNEIKSLCDKSDIDYNSLKYLFELETRLGEKYFNVPGHDGSYGYGGKCLPKDVSAIIRYSTKKRSKLSLLDTVQKNNTLLRLK